MNKKDIAALVDKGKDLLFSKHKTQEALSIFQTALAESEKQNLSYLTAKSLTGLGNVYRYLGKSKEALIALFQSNQIFESIDDHTELAFNYLFIGIVYWQIGTYDKALDFYFKSLALHREQNRDSGIANCYNNIGLVYWHLKNQEKALEYYYKALELKRKHKDQVGISVTLNNIGNIYYDYKDYDKALQYHRQSYELDLKLNRLPGIASGLNNIGSDLMRQNKYDEAIEYLDLSLKKKQELTDFVGEANTVKNIGKLYLEQKKYKKAEEFLLKSIQLAQKTQSGSVQRDAFRSIARLYEEMGNLSKALEWYKQFDAKKDEFFNDTSRKKISEIETNFEIERIEKQSQLIHEKNKALEREITKRRKIEESLRLSEEKFRNLVETIEEGIVSFDENRKIIYLNSAAASIFGYEESNLLNVPFENILATIDFSMKEIFPSKKGETARNELEIISQNKEKRTIIITITSKYLNDKFVNFFGVFFDISERKQTEIALKSYKDHLKLINRILRHDVLNALTVITSSIRLFKHTSDVSLLQSVENHVNKSVSIINQMRDLEKFLSEHQQLKIIEVEKVIKRVAKSYASVEINIQGKGLVFADEAFSSVIDNLFFNAITHGKTRSIDVSISNTASYCKILIADFGCGIPDDIKEKVFEESFIYGDTGKSGLGLYIVKQTIDRYSGLITVEDNHPQGALFTLLLKRVG